MIPRSTIQFLKELKKNNNKPWFEKHRKEYEAAKDNFLDFTELLIKGISKFDPVIENLKPSNCTFRINRDIRFSKDKTPYKTNIAASFSRGGKKIQSAGYYFHCEPGESFAGGGLYMPSAPELSKIRQEIDYGYTEWKKLTGTRKFNHQFIAGVEGFERLTRPPKGYEENNPAIEYLKMKNFIVTRRFSDSEIKEPVLVKEILKAFETMKPLVDFLNRAFE